MENKNIIGVGAFKASQLAKDLVMEVLDNNRLSYGPMLEKFEKDFAKIHGSKSAIMSNSGTSALQLALQAMKELHDWQDGDEVIIPSLTFVATANIVLHNNMIPILVDIESKYYSINPELIEASITNKTRAIIPVHLFGHPCDMDPIINIAKKHNLKIIEDSAETMYANYKGKRVGSLGDIGCFSTYVAHLLVTGVGGLNTTNDINYAIAIRSLLNHGRDSIYISIDDDKNKTDEELVTIIERRFRFTSIGHSYRVTEMEGALGLAQLKNWEIDISKRRANANFLIKHLQQFENLIQLPSIRESCDHSFMMFPIVLKDQNKKNLVNYLEKYGIETRDMLPLTNQPAHQRLLKWKESDFPVAEWINNNGFYIGCHQELTEKELTYICNCFDSFFNSSNKNIKIDCTFVFIGDENTTLKSINDFIALRNELDGNILLFDCGINSSLLECLKNLDIELTKQHKNSLLFNLINNFNIDTSYMILCHLNGNWSISDLNKIKLQLNYGFELVIGSRFLLGGARLSGIRILRSLGNRLYNFLVNLLFNTNISDIYSQYRGFKIDLFKNIDTHGPLNLGMLKLSLHSIENQYKIQEIPTIEKNAMKWMLKNDIKTSLFSIFYILKCYLKI